MPPFKFFDKSHWKNFMSWCLLLFSITKLPATVWKFQKLDLLVLKQIELILYRWVFDIPVCSLGLVDRGLVHGSSLKLLFGVLVFHYNNTKRNFVWGLFLVPFSINLNYLVFCVVNLWFVNCILCDLVIFGLWLVVDIDWLIQLNGIIKEFEFI